MSEAKFYPGHFVWHELYSPDVAASTKFYGDLFGWRVDEADMGPVKYFMFMKGEQAAGGMLPLEMIGKQGVMPHWLGYVSVPNVDESAHACAANGGLVAMQPSDIPNIGRFAVLGDPMHAYTAAWRSNDRDRPPAERPPAGTFSWDQLEVSDPEKVATFYGKVYGWKRDPFPSSKETWTLTAAGKRVASLRKAPTDAPAHWLGYVIVDELDAARERAAKLGGKILVERLTLPTVGDFAVVTDNVGARIGLLEAPRPR